MLCNVDPGPRCWARAGIRPEPASRSEDAGRGAEGHLDVDWSGLGGWEEPERAGRERAEVALHNHGVRRVAQSATAPFANLSVRAESRTRRPCD